MSDTQNHVHSPKDQAVKLARMAGQIAAFFAHYPEEKAIASISEHINKFWSKKMRQDFLSAYKGNPSELGDLLTKALSYIKH